MSNRPPVVVSDSQTLREAIAAARRDGRTIGLVPTMGALHAGHASLVDVARRAGDFIIATIFVNPTQFGPGEDFQKYPRTLDADLDILAKCGADLVFTPPGEDMYRPGHATYVEPLGVAQRWEGEFRPGHFRGVATIVLKLFNLAAPNRAYFGQKDYQQSLVVRQMIADFDLPIELCLCPIIRDPDGLALSSRNAYLSPTDRKQALALSRALSIGQEAFNAGERNAKILLARMHEEIAKSPDVRMDYLALADAASLSPIARLDRPAVALVAARVGGTRLIDNALLPDQR